MFSPGGKQERYRYRGRGPLPATASLRARGPPAQHAGPVEETPNVCVSTYARGVEEVVGKASNQNRATSVSQ